MERKEYFSGKKTLQQIMEDVCFNNVNKFWGFGTEL